MSYHVKSLPRSTSNEASQLANIWDLMHIVHDIQDKPLMRIRQFSYSHVKGKNTAS